jgi:flavin reductase (DIM6/NTAB) family NADH-FMN oxidoreductase RutF
MRKDLGAKSFLYPMPVLMIGTYDENGEADLMNAAWGSIYDYNQITISLGGHVTTDNIRKNKAFTVSFATKKLVAACDFVGLVSKAKEPKKLEKAGFHPYKSDKVNAPMFEEFPLTLECKLISLDGNMGEGGTLIGEIVNVSVDESILTDGKIDVKKLEPLAFDGANAKYHVLGEEVANAFNVGLKLK